MRLKLIGTARPLFPLIPVLLFNYNLIKHTRLPHYRAMLYIASQRSALHIVIDLAQPWFG